MDFVETILILIVGIIVYAWIAVGSIVWKSYRIRVSAIAGGPPPPIFSLINHALTVAQKLFWNSDFGENPKLSYLWKPLPIGFLKIIEINYCNFWTFLYNHIYELKK